MLVYNLQLFGGRGNSGDRGYAVTADSAYESYFEYENAQLMKEYSRTGKMATHDMNGRKLSAEERNRLKAQADFIEANAKNTGENTLYRGMVLTEAQARALNVGDTYTIDSLTSTSTDRKISSIYSNPENAYHVDNGVPVIMTFQQSGGITGFRPNKATPEVILTKGQKYRVARNYMDRDGVIHIELYASKKRK